ncbi:MAG: hypothetical protein ABIA67_04020, partial [Candidatus Margulisiibacteriota bacterium]
LEAYYARTDDATNPTQLDMNRVYSLLADLYGTSVEQIRDKINCKDKYLQEVEAKERREWEIIGELSEENVVYTAADDTLGIHEARVNAMREELVSIQDEIRLICMLLEAASRLKRVTIKITTGLGDIEVGKDAQKALKAGFENRQLAFDLKFAGIKNRVEAKNIERQQKKQLSKARWSALGSAVGMGVAAVVLALEIVAIPFTAGASVVAVVATVGFVAAVGQLGAALSSIIWNALNPIDDGIYDKTDFYDKAQDAINNVYNDQIDLLDEHSHINAEESSSSLSAGNQWAKKTKLFMDVRNELTQIYIEEQIMLMYIKGLQSIKSIATSGFTGVYTGGDFSAVQGSSSARFQQKTNAFELKGAMIEDIISRRNLAVDQRTELNWAIVSAVISAVQIVCSGITSGLTETANGAVGAAKEAADASLETMKGVNFAVDLGATAAQATKNILDATSGYGELAEYNKLVEMIDTMLNSADYYLDSQSRQTLRDALTGVNENEMLDSVGNGSVSANGAKYYEGMRAIQQMYNRIIIMLKVAEAIARIRAGIAGAPVTVGASEAYEGAKANHLKQLDLLNERVQTYVERSNAMADAWRQFTVSVVKGVFQILMKIIDQPEAQNTLKAKLNKSLGTDKAKIEIGISDKAAVKLEQGLTGKDPGKVGTWDKSIGASDIVNLAIDLTIFSPQFIKLITRGIYDAAVEGKHQSAKVEKKSGVGKTSQALSSSEEGEEKSQITVMEDQAYNNMLESAELGIIAAELGIERQNQKQFLDFLTSTIDSGVDSVMNDSWTHALDLLKAEEAKAKSKGVAVPDSVVGKVTGELGLKDVKWNDKGEVVKLLEKIEQKIEQAIKAKEAKGEPLSLEQRNAIYVAAAAAAVDFIEKNPNLRQDIISNLEDIVNSNSSRDKALVSHAQAILDRISAAGAVIVPADHIASNENASDRESALKNLREQADPNSSHDIATKAHALGVLGNLCVPRGKADPVISAKEVDNLIYNVWQKVASGEISEKDAEEICKYVQEYRPIAVKIGKLTADILSSEPPILKEVKANLAAIDWDSQQDVSKKLGKVVKIIQDQKAEKSEQEVEAIKQASVALAAQMIVSSEVREKALKKIDHIVKNSKDAALVDYADSILTKIKSASALRAGAKQITPTLAAKGEKASRTTELFLSVHSKALIMEEAVQDRRTPSPQQFKDLRSDALKLLTIQDTKALG